MEDPQRERDILELCEQVINARAIVQYTSCCDYTSCPFCGVEVKFDTELAELPHEPNCAYFIAKDLKTNL